MFHQFQKASAENMDFRVFEVFENDPELQAGFYWESVHMGIEDNEAMGPFVSYNIAQKNAEEFFNEEIA